jgi:hypothetical protein
MADVVVKRFPPIGLWVICCAVAVSDACSLKMKLEDYQLNGKEGWEKFKAEFNHDMDELGSALKNLTEDNTK